MTRCAYAEGRLRTLIDGELSPGEAGRVLAHLERCAACRDIHASLLSVTQLVQDQELEDVPAHFSASLQVRLAAHRRDPKQRVRISPVTWLFSRFRRPLLAGGFGTAVALAAILVSLSQSMGAADIARRAQSSWERIQNYGCVFVGTGVYQGKSRKFNQRQFYRRPGEFRFETGQDYPLTTLVFKDRIIYEMKGGDWDGRGPLVIVRPRREGQSALPFPFGVTWQDGGNISLGQLVGQLGDGQHIDLLGTERVGEHDCYHLRFNAAPPGGRDPERYEMWIDRELFLPRRVSRYRDEENHIVFEAQQLQVDQVLPAETFTYQPPDGAVVIYGDVDPHVFALKPIGGRKPSYNTTPTASARSEAARRAVSVPFPVSSPDWLPDGFRLVRVRRSYGRWVDMYWLRGGPRGPAEIVKLVEQPGDTAPETDLAHGHTIELRGAARPIVAKLVTGDGPYRYGVLGWRRGATRFTLFGARLTSEELIRIAESMVSVTEPAPRVTVARRAAHGDVTEGEPSETPSEVEAPVASPEDSGAASATSAPEQPPMMPEVSDDDRMPAAQGDGASSHGSGASGGGVGSSR
jgi:outer membrane lipoprotein-sorting protein